MNLKDMSNIPESYKIRNRYQIELWYCITERYKTKHNIYFQTKDPGFVVEREISTGVDDEGKRYSDVAWLHSNIDHYDLRKLSHLSLIKLFVTRIKETLVAPLDNMNTGRGYIIDD